MSGWPQNITSQIWIEAEHLGQTFNRILILWFSQRLSSVLWINFKPHLKGGESIAEIPYISTCSRTTHNFSTFSLSEWYQYPAYFCEQGHWSHAGIFHNPHPKHPQVSIIGSPSPSPANFAFQVSVGITYFSVAMLIRAPSLPTPSPHPPPHPPSTTTEASQLFPYISQSLPSPVHSVYCSQRILSEM